ncbi:DUF1206 domain-containing protein [Sphingosinicella terrae]|uniref:DUF1206 domain-containing protein n=1 Tax=Sphingosinicella terrae TaxID=2172047 RepID=UPI000E0D1C74|nr:DUF1206 domain-containing protein [Sphingosinicella terrae]
MLSVGAFEAVTRLGFAARGVMYGLIGYLALRLGRTEDGAGSLAYLSSPMGRILLVLLAVGFIGYGLWRLAEAVLDSEGHGDDAKGRAVRLGGAVSGFIHLGLAWLSLKLGLTDDAGGGGDSLERGAAAVLEWPGGEWLLTAGAFVLLVTGGYQLVKAVRLGFLRHLEPTAAHRAWVAWLGRAGYLARGIVFLAMALLLWRAGAEADAGEAGGMGQAMDAMPPTLRWAIALGLFLFGLFSLVEARHRRLSNPDLVRRLKRAAAR